MLKNIIIPEKIGSYFIYPQRIIGFYLDKNFVCATQIYVSGKRNIKIIKYFEEKLNLNDGLSLHEKQSHAIRNILFKTGKYDYIKVSLPSYLVIYKELILPFTDIDKIRSILDFEIEPILPFSINEAISDFIITHKNIKDKITTIMVAVARKKDISDLIEPFKIININPSKVIVDVIGIYGIYNSLPKLQTKEEGVLLIDMEYNHSNIVYILDGQLKIVRSLHYGVYGIIKGFADYHNLDYDTAYNYLHTIGTLDNTNVQYHDTINNVLSNFISNITFTINSFKTLLPFFSEIKKILLTGRGLNIVGLDKFLATKLNIPCELISIESILEDNKFSIEEKIPNNSILSLSIAYPAENNENFNLLQQELKPSSDSLIKKQIFTLIFLLLSIFIALLGYNYLQIKKLKNEITVAKSELVNVLKTNFSITAPEILRNLSEIINFANTKVNEEENIWFSFSNNRRFSFLKYLQELSSIIDRAAIGLNLKLLTISEGLITLEGEVKDFKALEVLENELNSSKLFSHVTIPQETKFTIKLTIKNNGENS